MSILSDRITGRCSLMAAVIKTLAYPARPGMGRSAGQRPRNFDSFNPLADGILMLHQRQVAALKASIIAIPKGRRTGITLARC